jgi:hypothetical protein
MTVALVSDSGMLTPGFMAKPNSQMAIKFVRLVALQDAQDAEQHRRQHCLLI